MTWMISGSVILRSLRFFWEDRQISLGDKFMGIPVGFPHLICFHLFFHPLPIFGFLITFVGPSPYPVVRSQQFGVRKDGETCWRSSSLWLLGSVGPQSLRRLEFSVGYMVYPPKLETIEGNGDNSSSSCPTFSPG